MTIQYDGSVLFTSGSVLFSSLYTTHYSMRKLGHPFAFISPCIGEEQMDSALICAIEPRLSPGMYTSISGYNTVTLCSKYWNNLRAIWISSDGFLADLWAC